ncbi:tyrosine-protein phosphatase [Fructilactobacillus florum]|uniref:Tyrosine specific protein phosphatases domain-containing protein n=1 Tax=Fructilactobacillus florum DSM 22689 = JCM 16035 TaxID=1423745 RepID=A0A0R2CPV4_9LACO|nr:tyrosine-protein phosphatase [Fructilactobacillus florum]KRM90198.1 hypothetical protein FC87_GL001277 [Fructilactobacillus florum DSM 22689 = JCM 16035]
MENKRVLPLDSVDNPRELGGYETRDGHRVKWQKLIRTGSLGRLTATDLNYLEAYGVRADVDLRSKPEVNAAGDQLANSNIVYHFTPVFNEDRTDNSQDPRDFRKLLENDPHYGHDHMVNTYVQMISKKEPRQAFYRLFQTLLNNDQAEDAILFHCTAGKDRTGMAAVFILAALGVDEETIKHDYLLTNEVVRDIIEQKVADVKQAGFSDQAAENLRALYCVDIDYLNAALAEIKQRYGSMDNFLHQGIGLSTADLTKLRQLYLE